MRAIVTGHQGFVGHHIAKRLIEDGWEVTGVDDERAGVKLAGPVTRTIRANIADIVPQPAELIIHCAAHADVSRNWDSASERATLWRCNVTDTMAMLETLPKRARFVFISTLATTATEISPYAASKIAGEALAFSYFPNAAVLRLGAVVGSGYHHGHIADFVKMAKANGTIGALSNGEVLRSYVHVDDVVTHALTATPGVHNLSGGLWSPMMTAAMMGCPVKWAAADFGWRGDVAVSVARTCMTPVRKGVTEALQSLGWT